VAGPVIPTLAQLQQAALAVIEEVGYGAQLQADVRGFVDVRLRSLRIGSAGRFFEGGHPGDVAALLDRNVVLAIEDVANDEDKTILVGTWHTWMPWGAVCRAPVIGTGSGSAPGAARSPNGDPGGPSCFAASLLCA
jgi:hypothetical protein